MNGKKWIEKRKRECDQRQTKFGAFDFETSALDGEVVFGTLQREIVAGGNRSDVKRVYSAAGMLDLLIENNAPKLKWFAHNLEFDLLFILREAAIRQERGEIGNIELRERGLGNFYACIIELADGSKLHLYDSLALYPFKLEYFLEQFSAIGNKLVLDFEIETFDIKNPYHIDYAERDTEGLLDAMVNYDRALYSIFGVHLKATVSSTALAAWEVTLKKEQKYKRNTETQEKFSRSGYFGGLVFLTDTNAKSDYVSIDANSMYPYVMRKYGVPCGAVSFITGKMHDEKPGLYLISAKAPDNIPFGCLGFRDHLGICWPLGEFKTAAWDFEIRRALEWGYQIAIINGQVWDKIDYPFDSFVDICEAKRIEYKGQSFEIVVKLMQNSLYGKFGTKTEGNETGFFPNGIPVKLDDGEWLPYIDPDTGGMFFDGVYQRTVEREAYYMFPHWAGYITARARFTLLNAFEASEGRAVYGDTDSLKMSRVVYEQLKTDGIIPIGNNEYGNWKLDEQYKMFRASAPKVYSYFCEKKQNYSGKGKGVPSKQRTPEFWANEFAGEKQIVEYHSLDSFKKALKSGGKRELNKRTRTTSDLANSNSWVLDEQTGRVKAVKIVNGKREKE